MRAQQEHKDLMTARGWLHHVPADFRDDVFAHCRLERYAPGQMVYDVGDPPGGVFGLISGRVEVLLARGGDLHALAYVAQPSDWIGGNVIFTRRPRLVALRARSEAQFLHLPLHSIDRMVARDPGLWRWLGLLPAMNIADALIGGEDLMRRDPKHRCIAAILRAAGCRLKGSAPAIAQVSQEDLAAMSNLSRSAAAAILAELEDAGLITRSYGRIHLLRPENLRDKL